MLLYNVWYFFYFGGLVCIWPYLNILYRRNGLSDAQIGVLAAVKPWTSAPASFLWSGVADRFSAHKAIMLSTFIASTLTRTSVSVCHSFAAFFVLSLLGEFLAAPVGVMADAAVVAACKRDTDYGKSRLWGGVAWGSLSAVSGAMVSHFGMWSGFLAYVLLSAPCVYCAWHMEFKLGVRQPDKQQQQQQGETELHEGDVRSKLEMQQHQLQQQQQGTAYVYDHNSSTDVQQHQHQQEEQQRLIHKPGMLECGKSQQQRLPEKLSDAVVSSDAGSDACVVLLHHMDQLASQAALGRQYLQEGAMQDVQQQEQHDASKALKDGAIAATSHNRQQHDQAATQQQQQQHQQHHYERHQQQQQQPEHNFWLGLQQLLSSPAVLIFMWQATVMGFGIGVIGEFLFLYLQDLGGSETLMGLTLTVTCISEVPMFHFQPQILRVVSVHSMLHFVMWTYALRMGLYALLPYVGSAWAVLPVELLHGITFGCGWSAGTITSKRVAPPGLEATMQGIFQGLYFGVGQGLGALIGGLLKQQHGGQAMFVMCSGIVLAGWGVCVVAEQATAWLSGAEGAHICQPACAGAIGAQQQQQQQQEKSGVVRAGWIGSRVHRLSAAAAKVMGAAGNLTSSGDPVSEVAAVRQWKHKYSELASKNSGGPDLQCQQGLGGTAVIGD